MSRDRCLRVSFFNLDRWRHRAVDRAAARRSVAPAVVRLCRGSDSAAAIEDRDAWLGRCAGPEA